MGINNFVNNNQLFDNDRKDNSFKAYEPKPVKSPVLIPISTPLLDLNLGRTNSIVNLVNRNLKPLYQEPERYKPPKLNFDLPNLTPVGDQMINQIKYDMPPGLTPEGRQEMLRIHHGLPPGLTPYAMGLPGMKPLGMP